MKNNLSIIATHMSVTGLRQGAQNLHDAAMVDASSVSIVPAPGGELARSSSSPPMRVRTVSTHRVTIDVAGAVSMDSREETEDI